MSAPISVVIPTLNAADVLSTTLEALMEGLDAGLIAELIVTDGGSQDDTTLLAEAWGARIVTGAPSRGGQLRRGCEASRAPWMLVLHSDTQLEPGWATAVAAHLGTSEAAYFRLRFDQGGTFVAAWANFRSRWFGLPYGDQGLLIPRRLYKRVGGYADVPLMEDVAIARALRGHLYGLDVVATTRADRYRRQGWVRRGSKNLWLLMQYFAGVAPSRLAEKYQR